MNKFLFACAALLVAAPMAAYAGEGNGPDFPGLQIPNVGVTTYNNGSRSVVSDNFEHSARDQANPPVSFPAGPAVRPARDSFAQLNSHRGG